MGNLLTLKRHGTTGEQPYVVFTERERRLLKAKKPNATGTGKTHLAKALAHAACLKFLSVGFSMATKT